MFSVDYRIEDIASTILGDLMKKEKLSRVKQINYLYGKNRQIFSLSAGQSVLLENMLLKVNVLGQYYINERKFYLLPASELLWHLKTIKNKEDRINLTLFISAGKGVRAPTFTDLYYRTGDIVGNAYLKAEQAINLEIGTILNVSQLNKDAYLKCKVNLFFRWGNNMIDFVKKENDSLWKSINQTNVFFVGNELMLDFYPLVLIDNSFLQSISLYYTYLYSDKQTDGYISRYVLDHLIHRLSLQLSHRIYKEWAINYAFSYNVRKGKYLSYTHSTGKEIWEKYPPFFLLDIRMYYVYRNLYLYLEVSNALNSKYFDVAGLEQAGFWINGGVKYKFVWNKKS